VEYQAYDYEILIEFANCALLTGRWQEGLDASNELLSNPNLPQKIKGSLISNRELALKKISEQVVASSDNDSP